MQLANPKTPGVFVTNSSKSAVSGKFVNKTRIRGKRPRYTGDVTKTNDNLRISVLLDRLQITSEAPTPPTPPTIPGYEVAFDHFVRPQTNAPTYARCREYRSARNRTRIFWQYQRRAPWLKPWKVTLVADDRNGLTSAEVWQVIRYCRSYQLLLVELAFDFSIPSPVNRAFVRRYGIFGKSRRA
jgi:hypothetical protein